MSIDNKLIKALKEIMPGYDKGDKRHVTRVKNAWAQSSYLDEVSGVLYIKSTRLHDILRMGSKADAQYLVEQLPPQSKLDKEGICYIASCEIVKALDARMVGADIRKRGYLEYSEEIFRTIRDAPQVRMKQEEIRQHKEEMIKQLKKQRMKVLQVKYDELTNEPLEKRTAHFSHIRKKVQYSYEAVNIYNGLIVNQPTHHLITKANLQDEDDLLAFAITMEWNTDWYEEYIQKFG